MEKVENQKDSVELKDRYFITYILFYALGTVSVIPINIVTTATDFWMYKFRDPESNLSYNSPNRTGLQAEFVADYSIVSHVSNALFIILTIIIIRRLSMFLRITTALCGTVAVFVVTCIFVKVDTDSWQVGFMVLILIIGFILTGFCGMFLITISEMAPKFPPKYLAVLLTGQAISGILSALAQIISLSVDGGPDVNGLVYFGSGLTFVFLTLIGFFLSLQNSKFFKHYFYKEVQIRKVDVTKEKLLVVLNKIKFYLAALVVTSGSTVMIHPGLTSLVLSVDNGSGSKWSDVYFRPVITFLVYSMSDYVGRELAMILKKPRNPLILLGITIIRVGFVPMIMFCNAHPRTNLPVVFDEDYAYIIFIIIFSSTNGYLVNTSVIFASEILTEEEKTVGVLFLMIFMYVIMAGFSFAGNGLVQAL